MTLIPLTSALVSEVILIILVGFILFVLIKLSGGLLKVLFGVIMNAVLGVAAIFLLNFFFNIGIPLKTFTLIPTVLFGLPAVGTFVILRFFGML